MFCATQLTIVMRSPDLRADGKEINAISAKMYAHHIVATPDVIRAAKFLLKSLILLSMVKV